MVATATISGEEQPMTRLQDDYADCWASLEKTFDGTPGEK